MRSEKIISKIFKPFWLLFMWHNKVLYLRPLQEPYRLYQVERSLFHQEALNVAGPSIPAVFT